MGTWDLAESYRAIITAFASSRPPLPYSDIEHRTQALSKALLRPMVAFPLHEKLKNRNTYRAQEDNINDEVGQVGLLQGVAATKFQACAATWQ